MSRKANKTSTLELISGSEERNLNRLSLVLAASRVSDNMTSWERSWSSSDHSGVTINVRCIASAEDVVPHGIDNDILFGLTNAYIAANCPENNTILVTAHQLLSYAALPIGGHSYAAIVPSLTRLRNSTFTIQDSWYNRTEEQFQSLSTSLVQTWRVLERRKAPQAFEDRAVSAEALFQVTLDPDMARSIRLGYVRPVDLNVLRELTQILPRTLYRRLEDEKHPLDRPVQMLFQTPLLPWATRLGINGRPDTIRRALDAPHRQLIACGFLQDVHYLGRGKSQQAQYVFAQTERPPARPEAVAALTSRRITQGAALKYAAEYGLEAVQIAVRRFDELLATGYKAKSASGLLVDILRDPQKYQVINAQPLVTRPVVKAIPAESEPPEPEERSLHTARFILKKVTLPDAVKHQAAEQYLKGRATAAQLAALATDEEGIRTVMSWSEEK